ncbi:MAG: hypothetical protein RL548_1253, partial [Bacteroidota bacterium]
MREWEDFFIVKTKCMKNLLLLLFFPFLLHAQSNPINEKTKNMELRKGYFNYYWDATQGKIYLVIDKWNSQFLYVNSLPAGLGSNDIGLDRGQIGDSRIVYFSRVGKKVLLTQPNLDYRAVTNDPREQKAVNESFAQSVLFNFTVEAEDGNTVLVDATSFFLRDAHNAADKIRKMKQGTYTLSEGRSAIYITNTKNFPNNSEFEASLTFVGGSDAGRFVQAVAPSTEAITLRMHHSFVALPDNKYKPRVYDIRSGYFGITYFDYGSDISEPIQKMFISRHRLNKMTPNAAISEAVKPIIYYLDNGISVIPVRDKPQTFNGREYPVKSAYPWAKWQKELISKGELLHLMTDKYDTNGFGIVGGAVSGNFEIIDIDVKNWDGIDTRLFQDIRSIFPHLFDRLRIHQSPSKGYHILYRILDHTAEGNRKLAFKEGAKEAAIETRGEGGYVVA